MRQTSTSPAPASKGLSPLWTGLLFVLAVLLAVAAIFYFGWLRPVLLKGRQIGNHAHLQGLDACLREYVQLHGQYPRQLIEALPPERRTPESTTDNWGHPFHYSSDGATFLLVSHGRDGKPDGSDYAALRAAGPYPPDGLICGKNDADEVMSDLGWHRACGK